ncbi:MAG: DUF4926 domain-containing protein [Acidobacteria bacterium]|nr:DUF4926 domain-containing protein [Acidobacteriota bacterium]
MLFEEFDVVRSIKSLSENVPSGSKGTILFVGDENSLSYLVEFVEDGETLDILEVKQSDLVPFRE